MIIIIIIIIIYYYYFVTVFQFICFYTVWLCGE